MVIIADGRLKCHKRVLMMLQAMGVYQDEIRMNEVIDPVEQQDPIYAASSQPRPVTAHLYEYTCMLPRITA